MLGGAFAGRGVKGLRGYGATGRYCCGGASGWWRWGSVEGRREMRDPGSGLQYLPVQLILNSYLLKDAFSICYTTPQKSNSMSIIWQT